MISGGADNAARMFDITNGQSQQVAQHDAPVKVVKWIETPQGGILATGSWDKTVKVSICNPLNTCICLITPVITHHSTGICDRQLPLPPSNSLSAATAWTCNIRSW